MLRNALRRIGSGERGFTLAELLVVILIIGVLAAIALPVFLGQQEKGKDAASKSDARNLISHVEACFSREENYLNCTSASQLGNTGLDLGAGPGQVRVVGAAQHSYTITAQSKSGVTYTVNRDLNAGTMVRSCAPTATAGCPNSGSW